MCDCEMALDLISLDIDGQLNEDQRRALDEHLAHCDACRSLAEDLAALHAAMPEEEEVPEGFHAAVMDRVRQSKVLPLKPRRAAHWKSWAALAAVFAVVVVGGRSLSHMFSAGGATSGAAPAPAAAMPQTTSGGDLAPQAKLAGAPEQYAMDSGETAGGGQGSQDASAETAPAEGQTAPQTALMQLPREEPEAAGENGENWGEPRSFNALGPFDGVTPGETAAPGQVTRSEALDKLLETCPMPEDARRVESEDELGWETPWRPVSETDPEGQQVSTKLRYFGLSGNGKYYQFWLYTDLIDVPETGEGHASTLNFFAVSLDGTEVLAQRHDGDTGPESWEAYNKAISE